MSKNQFTVKLLDSFYQTETIKDTEVLTDVFLVMEYIEHDLKEVLDQAGILLNENQAVTIVYNLLLCLKFLHSANVIHRDLKPSNILINDNCTVKLCDFGFARSNSLAATVNAKQRPRSAVCFTRFYRPPEIIFKNKNYNEQADIWSFGCIASEVVHHMEEVNEARADKVLFKGSSCFPLSALSHTEKTANISDEDQLLKIMAVLSPEQDQLP